MNIIVFSKDRSLQLELFIRSFNKYVKDCNNYIIQILYTYSNDRFKEGYDKLINMNYTNVNFIKESNFKEDLKKLINVSDKYTVFFVDDIIFKNPIDFFDNQMKIFENDKQILCRSLRLHPRLTYCYAARHSMNPPTFSKNNIFNWVGQSGDYGYPMSVDGHIFRTEQILPYVYVMNYTNPNSFEGNMSLRPMYDLSKMICYDKSIIINNPCNIVQTNNYNFHGNESPEYLNSKFLEGYTISLDNIDEIDNISCHQEIKIKLIK